MKGKFIILIYHCTLCHEAQIHSANTINKVAKNIGPKPLKN